MKINIKLILLLFAFNTLQAQYTDIINSNRPGASVGAYSVGKNVFQIEGGLGYKENSYDFKSIVSDYSFNETQRIGTLFLRYGFLSERLELNLDLAYIKSKIATIGIGINAGTNTFSEAKGFNLNTLGLKYMLFQPKTERETNIRSWKANKRINWKEFIPTVSLSAQMHTNMVSAPFKTDALAFKAGIQLQNNFSSGLVFVGNVFADNVSDPNKRYFNYIAALTYAMTKKLSIFGEYEGKMYEIQAKENWGAFGLAYLFSKDLQVDLDARKLFGENYLFIKNRNSFYLSLGLSWRADMHKDSYKIKTSNVQDNPNAKGGDRATRKAAKKAARKNKKANKKK